jgi:hypothetical protein
MSIQAPVQVKSQELTRIKAMGAVALVALSALPVAAAPARLRGRSAPCASRPEVLKQLPASSRKHLCRRSAKNGSVIEVLTSDDGETWTILTQPAERLELPSRSAKAGKNWKRVGAKGERGA